MTALKKKVIVVGIGGASCSGKTLLAKHIRRLVPSSSLIVHQDDFVPPAERIPVSQTYGVQDWDDPETCMDWGLLRSALRHVRAHGALPDLHQSHDHLNKQMEVEIAPAVAAKWAEAFAAAEAEQRRAGFEVVWVLVDGFVLYWDDDVVDQLDVRTLLRVPHDTLKARREERQVYVLQNPDDAQAGGVWVDPPNYFTQIVYPAYIKAHARIFEHGDVERGAVRPEWRADGEAGGWALVVLSPGEGGDEMGRAVEGVCEATIRACKEGKGAVVG
ncbi:ribosylnicotinamide kinase [Cryptotrichosporon argae]